MRRRRRSGLRDAVAATLQAVTKLKGAVKLVAPGTLPNDGKVIADERPVRLIYFTAIRPSTPVRTVPSLRRYSSPRSPAAARRCPA